MLREFTLQPNEDKRIQVEGRFLVITQATGPIELTIGGTTPVTVDEKDRIHLRGDSPNDRAIRIKNVSGGVNTIELHTSDLLIDKRTGVDVQNSIAIQEDQRIGIDPGANIVQAIVQNPIRFDVDENTVKIAKNQCVGIDPKKNKVKAKIQNLIGIDPNKNTVKAEVQNLVGIRPDNNQVRATVTNELVLVPSQLIGIDPDSNQVKATLTHAVAIDDNQFIGIHPNQNTVDVEIKEKEVVSLSTLAFTSAENSPPETLVSLSIDAGDFRYALILTADIGNTGPIWMGGVEGEGTPIFAGERVTVEGSSKVDFIALTAHKLYASEIVYKVF